MKSEASFVSVATAIGLVTASIGGGMFMGALASDVETLEEVAQTSAEDHDRLIKVETEVEDIKEDVEEIKENTSEILDALRKIEARQDNG